MRCGGNTNEHDPSPRRAGSRAIPAADAREKALREAAAMFDEDSNIAQTILALISANSRTT